MIPDCSPGGRDFTLRWRHNDHAGVSNHQPHGCLINRLFGRKSKKTLKLRVTGLCAGNSPGTGEFPAQMASYAENVSIWWRHHEVSYVSFKYGLGCTLQFADLYGISCYDWHKKTTVYGDITWVSWYLKSPKTRLFFLNVFEDNPKTTSKICVTTSLFWECSGDRWIPSTKGQQCRKCVNFMTSSR